MKQCEEPFTLITPHICSNIRKAEAKLRKGTCALVEKGAGCSALALH